MAYLRLFHQFHYPRLEQFVTKNYYYILAGVLFCTYFPLIFTQTDFVNQDRALLYAPMEKIQTLKEYFLLFLNRQIYDIQPVRDLSIFFDIFTKRNLHISIEFHQNIALWLLINIFIYKVHNLFYKASLTSIALLLCFSTYPAFVNSVCWISARKHLLSMFFTLVATYYFLIFEKNKDAKGKPYSILYYFISTLCQPINLWLPIFFSSITYIYGSRKSFKKNAGYWLVLFVWMFVVAYVNYAYFVILDNSSQLPMKFATNNIADQRLLGIGRTLWHIIFPYFSSFDYRPDAMGNMIGVILIAPIFMASYKIFKKKLFIVTIQIFAYPMLLLYHRNTIVFFYDCYALTPSLFMLILCLFHFNNQKVFRYFPHLLLCCSLFFGIYTSQEAQKYINPEKFWFSSYSRSKTCHAKLLYANYLWYTNKSKQAYDASIELMQSNCKEVSQTFQMSLYKLILGRTIEFEKNLNKNEKDKLNEILFKKENLYPSLLNGTWSQEGKDENDL